MENKELSIFAERLRDLRYSLGISQTEFVEGIGITPSSLSAYEKNLKTPSVKVVKKIAEKYNVSIDWLCGLSDDRQINQEIRTYSDFFKAFLKISNVKELYCDFESQVTYIDCEHRSIGVATFYNDVVCNMFDDWNKMLSSYNNHVIDDEILKLWEEKTIKKFDFPINKEISDDDLPF